MNSSGVSKEVELHSFMGNFSGSFALCDDISSLVPEILSPIGGFVLLMITAAGNTWTSPGLLFHSPPRKCTLFIHRPSISTCEALVILLLLDASSLLSLHVLEKVSWQFLRDFSSPEQSEAAPLLVVSIKPDRETTCQAGAPERSRT